MLLVPLLRVINRTRMKVLLLVARTHFPVNKLALLPSLILNLFLLLPVRRLQRVAQLCPAPILLLMRGTTPEIFLRIANSVQSLSQE